MMGDPARSSGRRRVGWFDPSGSGGRLAALLDPVVELIDLGAVVAEGRDPLRAGGLDADGPLAPELDLTVIVGGPGDPMRLGPVARRVLITAELEGCPTVFLADEPQQIDSAVAALCTVVVVAPGEAGSRAMARFGAARTSVIDPAGVDGLDWLDLVAGRTTMDARPAGDGRCDGETDRVAEGRTTVSRAGRGWFARLRFGRRPQR